jgi:hypothetical protein
MRADEVLVGDVWRDPDGSRFMVREVTAPQNGKVDLRLSPGRTSAGVWITIDADTEVNVWRAL